MQTGLSKELHLLYPPFPLLLILSKGAGFVLILVEVLQTYISTYDGSISTIAALFHLWWRYLFQGGDITFACNNISTNFLLVLSTK